MSLKNIPGWLQGLVGGFIVGVWLWVISGVPYVKIIPILLTIGLEVLWRIIEVAVIAPVMGYPKPPYSGIDHGSTVYFLILICMAIGALLMSRQKALKYVGVFLLAMWALILIFAFLLGAAS
ncbi:MAG: hypothetical protein WC750_03865 [Patescibacteria group bacterium]|jgi:hypothetical protein